MPNLELYILLFFTYSFAGWFMESVGGIINVKKFINRGFLIGPYCPVYGIGVVIITVLLGKYKNDIPALFFLSILICGTLEYFTSYIMEKLFNARWWDYKNRKFNINGRICLETLIPFGIAGSLILYYVNPFFENLYLMIPDTIRHIIVSILSILFIIDVIVSFKIISSFKGEIYANKDNTEEISEKVKDKTEDVLMKAESDMITFSRKVRIKGLKWQKSIKYKRDRISSVISETTKELAKRIKFKKSIIKNKIKEEKEKLNTQLRLKYSEYELKQKEKKLVFNENVQKRKDDLEKLQKASKEKVDNTIKNIKSSSEEFTNRIKNEFKSKSILTKRLMEAFPSLQVKRLKDKNNKRQK